MLSLIATVAAVTGGTPSDDAAVVALVRGDQLVCSGTVIAPRAVLTAAHCIAEPLPEISLDGVRVGVVAALIDPAFDPDTLDHDVAVLVLDAPVAIAPLALGDAPAVGALVRVVGYGAPEPVERRTGTSEVQSIDAGAFVTIAAPAQACEGDSGGPALVGAAIVGITSSGDEACVDHARHIRADAVADFVADAVAATAEGAAGAGERCWYDANCAEGACLPALDEPRWSFCAPPCPCADGLACIDGACRHEAPSPGASGAACASGADCASDLCVAPAGGDAPVCAERCFADLPGFCGDGFSCAPADDGGDACFAAPEGTAGCSAGGGGASPFVFLFLYLVSFGSSDRSGTRMISMRRFFCLPFLLLLLATGSLSA